MLLQKIVSFITFISCSCILYSQNVGIGTNAPSEKLDVNGNINLRGSLKVNNNEGAPGQVLVKSNTNNLVWASPSSFGSTGNINSGYKHNIVITDPGSGSFNLPVGDTSFFIEIWGAGGGSSASTAYNVYCFDPNNTGACDNPQLYGLTIGCGGGGGGYLKALLKVSSGQSLNYYVGAGRVGDGDSSKVVINGTTLIAQGGKRGDTASTLFVSSLRLGGGFKGSNVTNGSVSYFAGINGGDGFPSTIEDYNDYTGYGKCNVNYGNGGDGANSVNTGGTGGLLFVRTTTGPLVSTASFSGFSSTAAKQPGGGAASNPVPMAGGNGMIIIWW